LRKRSTKQKMPLNCSHVDYEVLPAVTLEGRACEGAPKVWQDAASNVSFQLSEASGEPVDQVFAQAAHVTRLSLHYPRVTANTIEPRSVLGLSRGRAALHASLDHADTLSLARESRRMSWEMPELDLRVVSPDVGGGFGMKSQVYPEEILVLWAARKLDRPVKLVMERSDSISSDAHGRHQIAEAELALGCRCSNSGVRSSIAIDLGAYLSASAASAPNNATNSLSSTMWCP
jgi:carbon-monoxide dehydrogenase large subunit